MRFKHLFSLIAIVAALCISAFAVPKTAAAVTPAEKSAAVMSALNVQPCVTFGTLLTKNAQLNTSNYLAATDRVAPVTEMTFSPPSIGNTVASEVTRKGWNQIPDGIVSLESQIRDVGIARTGYKNAVGIPPEPTARRGSFS